MLLRRVAARGLARRRYEDGASRGAFVGARRTLFGWNNNNNNGNNNNNEKKNEEVKDVKVSEVVTTSGTTGMTSIGFGDAAAKPETVLGLGVSRVRFPGMVHSLHLSPEAAKVVAAERQAGRPYLGLFLRKDVEPKTEPRDEDDPPEEILNELKFADSPSEIIHEVGTFAQVHSLQDMPDGGGSHALVLVHRRINLQSIEEYGPPPKFRVEHWQKETVEKQSDEVRAMANEIVATIRELVQMNQLYREHMQFFAQRIDISDPYKLADFACSLATGDNHLAQLQQSLETPSLIHRLRLALELVSKEREVSKLQQKISQQVEAKITSQQRNFMLHEQLKAIKKELGLESDDKEILIQKFQHRIHILDNPSDEDVIKEEAAQQEKLKEEETKKGLVPLAAKRAIDEEVQKLQMLEKNSAEFNVTRSYLEWLTCLPWGKKKHERFDISEARTVLDADHYGMTDIKDRILELIAIGKLKGSIKGKILLLVGPPGTGKTSIANSIAQALDRDFIRVSVGGLSDVAEIKGHRRTYIGAMPGKPIQALKSSKSMNPLILMDEIDKIGSGSSARGDPASALLELLDPSQNVNFLDHYLDIPVDMSDCLFICTANVEHTIPTPLLDRMETIRLSGYDLEEKLHIAHNYLLPRALEASGLNPDTTKITDDALRTLIKGHAREAGVRSLQKLIDKVCRKLAFHQVSDESNESEIIEVNTDNLEDYIGKPKFAKDRLYDASVLPPGVVCGLAWTSMGGSTLYIETTKFKNSKDNDSSPPRLSTTGQLGSVMEESSRVAMAHVRSVLDKINLQSSLNGHEIHIHVPEGATPKDGPSAGVTLATALISLTTDIPIRSDLAMTGELSLTGRVLPVGGIKEKVIAARRAHISHICLPEDNRSDFDELPDYLKEGITPFFAQNFEDVLAVAFFQQPLADSNESTSEIYEQLKQAAIRSPYFPSSSSSDPTLAAPDHPFPAQ